MNALLSLAIALALNPPPPGDCTASPPIQATRERGPLSLSVEGYGGLSVLRVTGGIAAGATDQVRLALDETDVDEVWFDSAGGDREEAKQLGGLLRRAGLLTRVPASATCAGACVDAFLGGIARLVDPSAEIGVAAMPVSDQASAQSQAEREQAAGRWAERQADHYIRAGISRGLLRLQLETPAGTTCWLTRAAQQRYNVTNAPLIRPASTPPSLPRP